MKAQTQFYSNENGREYWEQYFETQTHKQITIEQYNEIKQMLDDLTHLLSDGKKVDVEFKIREKRV